MSRTVGQVSQPVIELEVPKKCCLRVLHVDDDESFLETSKLILEMDGRFEVETATSVDEAFSKIKEKQFDAIVSDYEMPSKNGLQFLRELREQKNEVAFIMFTGRGREEVAVTALNLGADRYVDKNGSPETVYCDLAHAILKTVERKKSTKLLVESESKYRMLVEDSLQGIAIAQGNPPRIMFANESMGKLLGYSTKELTSLSPQEVAQLIHAEDRSGFFGRLKDRLLGKTAESYFDFRAVRKDGSIVWLEAMSSGIILNGQPAVQGIFLNITDRIEAQRKSKESEEKYKALANALPQIVFEADLTGKLTFFSEQAFKITGYTPDELEKGMYMLQFIIPEQRERVIENTKKALAGKIKGPNEYTLIRRDGTTYPALVKTSPIISENRVTGLRGIVLDITERKKSELALREQRDKAEKYLNIVGNIILALDSKGKVTLLNKKGYEILGYNERELEGKDWIEICVPPDSRKEVRKLLEAYILGETGPEFHENAVITKNGEKRDVRWFNTLLKEDNGNIIGTLSSGEDVTEQKKAVEMLRESEEKFRQLAEESPSMIFINQNDRVVYANKECAEKMGYVREEFYSPTFDFRSLIAQESKEMFTSSFGRHMKGEEVSPYECKLVAKQGNVIDAILTTKLIHYNGKTAILGIITDITERKEMEQKLKEEHDKLESITENIGAGLVAISKDYKILWMNNYLKQLTGASENNHCYSSFNTCNKICPDCGPKKIFEEGASIDRREYCNKTEYNKDHPVWFELIATPIKDKDGNVVAALELTVNITEKKNMEAKLAEYSQRLEKLVDERTEQLKQTQAKLVKSERLAAIGELAGMVGHDLRNPLAGMRSALYYLNKHCTTKLNMIELKMLQTIDDCVNNSDKIVNDLLDYSREIKLEVKKTTVKELIRSSLKSLDNPVTVQVIDMSGTQELMVDVAKMKRVLINLFKNAFEAMPDGGKLEITSRPIADEKIEIKVRDTGVGMSTETMDRIWTPLFTTKAKGMGFGLPVCKRLVEAHGGRISATSEIGRGTTFTVRVPKQPLKIDKT